MMAANTFSDEDYQLCEENQLGTPLHIYRLKPGSIRFLRITGSIIFTIGIISLVVLLIPLPHRDFTTFLPVLIGSLYALFNGGVFYGIMVRRARSMRVIVCEHGLLQTRKMIRHNAVEVVYWQNIRKIHKVLLGEYSITYQDGRPFASLTLTRDYQNLDELVALITERQQKFAHEEARFPLFPSPEEG